MFNLSPVAHMMNRHHLSIALIKFLSLVLLVGIILPHSVSAEKAGISTHDLNHTEITGQLGVPLHTVHKVECKVVDMSFTGAKADSGRLAFQVIVVGDRKFTEAKYIDLPESILDKKPAAGDSFSFWAYETVEAAGYPTEAFEKIGEPSFATMGLHFRPKLVILKML